MKTIHEKFKKVIETIEKNQTEILELKKTVTTQKKPIVSFNSTLTKQKKELVSIKTGHLKSSSQRSKKKRLIKCNGKLRDLWDIIYKVIYTLWESQKVQRKRKGRFISGNNDRKFTKSEEGNEYSDPQSPQNPNRLNIKKFSA